MLEASLCLKRDAWSMDIRPRQATNKYHPPPSPAPPQYDITAYAADDHLNLITTATTSDGGVDTINSATEVATAAAAAASHRYENTEITAAQQQEEEERAQLHPSSSVHLWDAERMSLVGTLLFPNPALTRDLANRCSASEASNPCHSHPEGSSNLPPSPSDPGVETKQTPTTKNSDQGDGTRTTPGVPPTKTTTADQGRGTGTPSVNYVTDSSSVKLASSGLNHENTEGTLCAVVSGVPLSAKEEEEEEKVSVPAAIGDSGTSGLLSRATLVTALVFLSPYPLLAGASTGGTVALWRVPNGVCVQVGGGRLQHC